MSIEVHNFIACLIVVILYFFVCFTLEEDMKISNILGNNYENKIYVFIF